MSERELDKATAALDRTAITLAAIWANQLEGENQPVKARRLSHLGFSNIEIAHALGTTPNSINVALHRARRRGNGSRSKS